MELEVRKVQQVGYSTLVVSLPREWVKEVGLKQGDVVSLMRDADGTLRLLPGVSKESKSPLKVIVEADKIVDEGLLTRLITGMYIIGHDTIQIVSRKGLSKFHLDEIRKTVQRLTGISIVEQTLTYTTLQNFVDPTKFPVNGLLRRLYIITSSMLNASNRSLREKRKDLANEVLHMENEVDRIYWMVVRQLLLAIRDRTIGKKLGIEHPLHIVGSRTVAKFLEEIGDCIEEIATETIRMIEGDYNQYEEDILGAVYELFDLVEDIYSKAVKAFFQLDLKLANEAAQKVDQVSVVVNNLTEKIFTTIRHCSEAPSECAVPNLNYYLSLRTIIWTLGQIADYCSTICEITINRYLEEPSDICKFENA
ncbi:MAG: PhoU domain-containing protein [Nitrososphaerales archaeon]